MRSKGATHRRLRLVVIKRPHHCQTRRAVSVRQLVQLRRVAEGGVNLPLEPHWTQGRANHAAAKARKTASKG